CLVSCKVAVYPFKGPKKAPGPRSIPAVPVLDCAVARLQEAKQASVGLVPQRMASRLDAIACLDGLARYTDLLELTPSRRFERPHLGRTALRFDVDVQPGMRRQQVQLLHDAFDIPERLLVLTVRVVG